MHGREEYGDAAGASGPRHPHLDAPPRPSVARDAGRPVLHFTGVAAGILFGVRTVLTLDTGPSLMGFWPQGEASFVGILCSLQWEGVPGSQAMGRQGCGPEG